MRSPAQSCSARAEGGRKPLGYGHGVLVAEALGDGDAAPVAGGDADGDGCIGGDADGASDGDGDAGCQSWETELADTFVAMATAGAWLEPGEGELDGELPGVGELDGELLGLGELLGELAGDELRLADGLGDPVGPVDGMLVAVGVVVQLGDADGVDDLVAPALWRYVGTDVECVWFGAPPPRLPSEAWLLLCEIA